MGLLCFWVGAQLLSSQIDWGDVIQFGRSSSTLALLLSYLTLSHAPVDKPYLIPHGRYETSGIMCVCSSNSRRSRRGERELCVSGHSRNNGLPTDAASCRCGMRPKRSIANINDKELNFDGEPVIARVPPIQCFRTLC